MPTIKVLSMRFFIKQRGCMSKPSSPKNLNLRIDLNHLELIGFLGFGVQHVHGTGQSGIKGTDDPYDIEWILDVSNGCSNESFFNGTRRTLIIPGGGVPDRCCHNLVLSIFRSLIEIQCPRAPWRFGQPCACCFLGIFDCHRKEPRVSARESISPSHQPLIWIPQPLPRSFPG